MMFSLFFGVCLAFVGVYLFVGRGWMIRRRIVRSRKFIR